MVTPIRTRATSPNASHLFLEPLEDRRMLSTCHVTRLADSGGGFGFRGDLRYCINKVNDNPGPDKIVFQPTAYGTINLASELPVLASDIEILGPGAELLTIRRDTGGDYRIFYIDGDTVTINGMTIANGRSDKGGGIYNRGTLYLNSVVVSSNASTAGLGGGIYNYDFLAMTDTTISANSVSHFNEAFWAYGGGLFNSGTVTILTSTIANNQAKHQASFGGGIYNLGSMTIEYSAVSENTALNTGCDVPCSKVGAGGGIATYGTLTISSSTVAGNLVLTGDYAATLGGGIASAGSTTIFNSTVVSNRARSKVGSDSFVLGGGVFQDEDGSLLIEGSTISANSVDQPGYYVAGGGVNAGWGNAEFRNSIIANNFSGASCPDFSGTLASSGYNLIGDSTCGSGFGPTDILNVDPLLGDLENNGGPTETMALLPGSPAIDAGDNTDAPEWDQRGPGFPRIVNGTIDIGAFEVQATGSPNAGIKLAVLVTADFDDNEWLGQI